MAIERQTVFSPGTVIRSAEVNEEFDQIVSLLNGQTLDKAVFIGGNSFPAPYNDPDAPGLARLLVAGQAIFLLNASGAGIRIYREGDSASRIDILNTGQVRTVSSQSVVTPSTTLIVLKGTYACKTSHIGNVGAGEDDLISLLIGAHTLEGSFGQYLEIRASGYTAANATNKTIKGYFGGVEFLSSGAVGFNNKPWFFNGDIVINNNTSNSFRVTGIFECDTTKVHVDTVVGPLDATLDQTLKFTGESGADNDIVMTKFIVEKGFGLN